MPLKDQTPVSGAPLGSVPARGEGEPSMRGGPSSPLQTKASGLADLTLMPPGMPHGADGLEASLVTVTLVPLVPVAPFSPFAPFAPTGHAGPAGRCAPAGPAGPVAPLGPLGPLLALAEAVALPPPPSLLAAEAPPSIAKTSGRREVTPGM